MDWTELTVALIGLAGVLFTAVWGRAQQLRAAQAEAEITLHRDAFDFTRYTQEWGDTIHAIRELQFVTSIDRFLLLVCFNGKRDPRWVSDILQVRDANQQPTSYRHLEIDDQYRDMVRDCIKRPGGYVIKTDEMPDCILRSIYKAEEVTEAVIFHIETRQAVNGSVAYTICSFATKNADGIDDRAMRLARVLAGRISGLAAAYSLQSGALPRTSVV